MVFFSNLASCIIDGKGYDKIKEDLVRIMGYDMYIKHCLFYDEMDFYNPYIKDLRTGVYNGTQMWEDYLEFGRFYVVPATYPFLIDDDEVDIL